MRYLHCKLYTLDFLLDLRLLGINITLYRLNPTTFVVAYWHTLMAAACPGVTGKSGDCEALLDGDQEFYVGNFKINLRLAG
jgi:hypothetical protein